MRAPAWNSSSHIVAVRVRRVENELTGLAASERHGGSHPVDRRRRRARDEAISAERVVRRVDAAVERLGETLPAAEQVTA